MRDAWALAILACIALTVLCAPSAARAKDGADGTMTAQAARAPDDATTITPQEAEARAKELIKASQNPVGNIAIIPFQMNWNNGVGPQSRQQFNLNIQPVVPIVLTPNLNLIARTILPVINNPSPAPPSFCNASIYGCGSTFGIGDLTEQLFIAPKTKPNALIWGIGPQLSFPTGSPVTLSAGQYGAGPAAVALVMPGAFVIGALFTQLWSYAGDTTKPAVNSFLAQPFINYNFGRAWALTTSPIITSNWTAPPNQRWTVPIGGGISKTFKLGDQPMQLGVYYYTNIVRPANAPYNQFRFNWNLLFPVKRGS